MNKIKIFLVFTLLTVASFIIYSCSKEDSNQTNNKFKKVVTFTQNDIKIWYSSKTINDRLHFRIAVNDDLLGELINEKFDISLQKTKLSNEISNQISLKQNKLSSKFSQSEIDKLVDLMDNMINSVTKDMKNDELKDSKTQGLFMCNSLIKSISRKVKSNNIVIEKNSLGSPASRLQNSEASVYISNTVYEGYEIELSSFALTEDLIINVDNLKNYINLDKQYAELKGFLFVQEILNNISSTEISVYQLENEILEYKVNNPDKFEGVASKRGFKWPRGSNYGCYGNYSDPCYIWSPVCFVQDAICSTC